MKVLFNVEMSVRTIFGVMSCNDTVSYRKFKRMLRKNQIKKINGFEVK